MNVPRYWPAAALVALCAHSSEAAVFTVINTNDSGIGSLRQALTSANSTGGIDTIRFSIGGAATIKRIAPLTPLPTISEGVFIDGYSQPRAVAHSPGESPGAVILVQIDGTLMPSIGAGLGVCANNVIIQGLAITNFAKHGIGLGADNLIADCPGLVGSNNSSIIGNYIGMAPDGITAAGNALTGLLIGRSNNVIVRDNVIGANGAFGIMLATGTSQLTIDGNHVGLDASGTLDRGNDSYGISVTNDANDVEFGAIRPNRIGYNSRGVVVTQNAGRINLVANDFIGNSVPAIDLSATASIDGNTPNDALDADVGGNGLQNFPDNLVVTRLASGIRVSGSIARANAGAITYRLNAYAQSSCANGARAQGTFYGNVNVPTAAGPNAVFNVDLPSTLPLPVGSFVGFTLTDPNGNTSEFSPCLAVETPQTFTVTNTFDAGAGSLRQAILNANAAPGGDIIRFVLGVGSHLIQPATVLPAITDAVNIDGYTQAGSQPNTQADADDAVIRVELNGNSTSGQPGLDVHADNVQIRGLSITGYDLAGVRLGNGTTVVNGAVIEGNFLGLRPDGVTAAANGGCGVLLNSVNLARIGGADPAQRNLIAANGGAFSAGAGITSNGTDMNSAVVEGNFIGTTRDGITAAVNPRPGIVLRGLADGSRIGGDTPAQHNRIAYNTSGIVVAAPADNVRIAGNRIFGNSALGVDLAATFSGDGVSANDVDDADSGANGLQNFPQLNSAQIYDGGLRFLGLLDRSNASGVRDYVLRFHAGSSCHASGNGEGASFLGAVHWVSPGPTAEAFDLRLNANATAGSIITVTASSPDGTSEFSACTTLSVGDVIFEDGFDGE